MKLLITNLLAAACLMLSNSSCAQGVSSSKVLAQNPTRNYVPDAATAVRIAEAIWLPIYGKDIYQKKPFVAVLKDNTVWIVEGTLPKGREGGVPYIEISKQDGRVLQVTHGK